MKILAVIFAMLLLVGVAQAVTVEEQLQEGMRVQHYQGYPNAFTGYVVRYSGDTTSETMAYSAMTECTEHGNMSLCKEILRFADNHSWTNTHAFGWRFTDTTVFDQGSASDGDIPLLWAAANAYLVTNDSYYLGLYEKWSPVILQSDICDLSTGRFVASGSGIGVIENCNSYNGVYPNYVALPLIYDLSQFDPAWEPVYNGALKQSADALKSGTLLPNRCGAYNGSTFNWNLCEVSNTFDPNDAYRFAFWVGWECIERPGSELCSLWSNVMGNITTTSKVAVAEGGYTLNGSPQGAVQFNEYKMSMFAPSFEFKYGRSNSTKWYNDAKSKWNGQDFWGTSCWGVNGQQNCIDTFQDMWINLGFHWYNGHFDVDFTEVNITVPPVNETEPPVNETDYEALYLVCIDDLGEMNTTLQLVQFNLTQTWESLQLVQNNLTQTQAERDIAQSALNTCQQELIICQENNSTNQTIEELEQQLALAHVEIGSLQTQLNQTLIDNTQLQAQLNESQSNNSQLRVAMTQARDILTVALGEN